jgi:hypothetical protein
MVTDVSGKFRGLAAAWLTNVNGTLFLRLMTAMAQQQTEP